MRLGLLALGVGLLASRPSHAEEDPLYRVCVESVEHHTAYRWSWGPVWPYLSVRTDMLHTAIVRPLFVYSPSWMWEHPILNPTPAMPVRLEIVSTHPRLIEGTVVYVDAAVLTDATATTTTTVPVPPAALRANVRRIHGDHYELEPCPVSRSGLASR